MTEGLPQYWLITDGRALYNVYEATVLMTCTSYKEALDNIKNFGNDACIVDTSKMVVVYSKLFPNRKK